jgi:putative glycosyltransferase (TIGR04372 family)
VVVRKLKLALRSFLQFLPSVLALSFVAIIRLIRPWFLVRLGELPSPRIGHFAANTELYLCERNAGINLPKQHHADLFYMPKPICNQQLAVMWKRLIHIWPSWVIVPINRVNRLIPRGMAHEIGDNTNSDRDVHNLLERFPPHLEFTAEEKVRGEAGLQAMGIPSDTPVVCLIVRDSAYLDTHQEKDWSYHSYRDSDIQSYILAAEELANRGYFVIRMGVKVHEPIKSSHPRVIDYAVNGMRSDFMDVYLGAKCEFCISTGTGFDGIPYIFRRPIVYVNYAPLGYLMTFQSQSISILKHHFSEPKGRELTVREIFTHGMGYCLSTADYESKGVHFIENTEEEICDVVVEMADRLKGTWWSQEEDEVLQERFWDIYTANGVDPQGRSAHGEILSRIGAAFLRNNRDWLQ